MALLLSEMFSNLVSSILFDLAKLESSVTYLGFGVAYLVGVFG